MLQVTETQNDGLKRQLDVVVEASYLADKYNSQLKKMKSQAHIRGFRPGKVPLSHLQKLYGEQVLVEVVQKALEETSAKALEDTKHKPAYQPKLSLDGEQDENFIKNLMPPKGENLSYKLEFEILPTFDIVEAEEFSFEKWVCEVSPEDINESLDRIAESQREYAPADEGVAIKDGDKAVFSFAGRLDGELFEGGSSDRQELVVGSKQFLPEFEEALLGMKAGEEKKFNLTFPENYGSEELSGKQAEFTVNVAEVLVPQKLEIDDAFADKLGMESLDNIKTAIEGRIADEYRQLSLTKLKRDVLDKLDGTYSFDLPSKLVDEEFDQIWQALQKRMEEAKEEFGEGDESEENLRIEYKKLAARRVRLGLVVGAIGEKEGIEVTQQELQQALQMRAQEFPGQEQEFYSFFQKNPERIEALKPPIFEQKVIDYITEKANTTDRLVSRTLLMQVEGDEENKLTADSETESVVANLSDQSSENASKTAKADKEEVKKEAKPKKKAKAKTKKDEEE